MINNPVSINDKIYRLNTITNQVTKMAEKKNIHKGHRNRLRAKIRTIDSDMFEPHELLEFLLYSVMAQQNTNELAHNLLAHFNNSISDVFDASAEELMEVDGIGLQSALMLNTLPILSRLYFISKNETKSVITAQNIFQYCIDAAGEIDDEGIVITFLNAKNEVIKEKILTDDICRENSLIDVRNLISHIIHSNAAAAILTHKCTVSAGNLKQFDYNMSNILSYFMAFNIKLIDYIVINGDEIISMRNK